MIMIWIPTQKYGIINLAHFDQLDTISAARSTALIARRLDGRYVTVYEHRDVDMVNSYLEIIKAIVKIHPALPMFLREDIPHVTNDY